MRLFSGCVVIFLVVSLCGTQGNASKKTHRIKKEGSIPRPNKNIPRSALEGIKPEELEQEAEEQKPEDERGTKKSDLKLVNLQAVEDSNKLFDTSQQLSRLPPKEAEVVSDFLKDMDKNNGELTPQIMKKMVKLEDYQPQQKLVNNRQMAIQGYQRNLGPDTRPVALPFKLDDQKTYRNSEDLGEESEFYDSNPLPEYNIKETRYDLPTTTENENTNGFQENINDYDIGDNKGIGQDFESKFAVKAEEDRSQSTGETDSDNLAVLLGKKGLENRLITEIGRRVLLNILGGQQNTSSAGIGGLNGQQSELPGASIGTGETIPFMGENSNSLLGNTDEAGTPSSLPQLRQNELQNSGSLQHTELTNFGSNERLSLASRPQVASFVNSGNNKLVMQEPHVPVANQLNSKLKDASILDSPAPSQESNVAVSGKLNTVQTTSQPTKPTTKLFQVLNNKIQGDEKIKIIVPGGKLADFQTDKSENSKPSKDTGKDKDDVVMLKISGQGKPVSFKADASTDGSIVLRIPKKFSENFVKSDGEKDDVSGSTHETKSEAEKNQLRKIEDADARDLAGKLPPNSPSGNSPTVSSWEISGKKSVATTPSQNFSKPTNGPGNNGFRDSHPTRNVLPLQQNQQLQGNLQVKGNLVQSPETVAKSLAELTQALWAGITRNLGTAQNVGATNNPSAQRVFPFLSQPSDTNIEQLMSRLAHVEELPATQVGATMYDGTSPTNYGVRQNVGREEPFTLKSLLRTSKLIEDTAVARNKGVTGKNTGESKAEAKEDQHNSWSPCTVSCGHGIQARARPCPRHDCSGFRTESRPCYSGPCPEQLAKAGLKLHNKFRAWHRSPPLKWSRSLAKKAQQLADSMALNGDPSSGLSDKDELPGENIATIDRNYDIAAERATTKWYEEVKGYSFQQPSLGEDTKHFSQLIWKGTKKVGIGVAKNSAQEKTYVVALYDPPGNVEGAEIKNIHMPDMAPS